MANVRRLCPTPEGGSDEPLFMHTITPGRCSALQANFYHKCAKCVYRSADVSVFEGGGKAVPRRTARVATLTG